MLAPGEHATKRRSTVPKEVSPVSVGEAPVALGDACRDREGNLELLEHEGHDASRRRDRGTKTLWGLRATAWVSDKI